MTRGVVPSLRGEGPPAVIRGGNSKPFEGLRHRGRRPLGERSDVVALSPTVASIYFALVALVPDPFFAFSDSLLCRLPAGA